ncbi:MAG: type II toxin-antitoxin system RelE/ParE family toxin [Planctomycetes bacterium]|nr:type II toxin-antitoxin system RelE/ParE family toxin [Planctomycetota bacterium]
MPATKVFFYQDDDGGVPVLDWLRVLRGRNERAFRKCFAVIRLLQHSGYELRRPHADMLRDGVYELRAKVGNVNYRILYGFVGKDVALLASGLTKEKTVPSQEIDRAAARIEKYLANPEAHGFSYKEEDGDG